MPQSTTRPDEPADASRTPIVLVHGSGSCSAMWYPNTPAFSAERTVYAIGTPLHLVPANEASSCTRSGRWSAFRA